MKKNKMWPTSASASECVGILSKHVQYLCPFFIRMRLSLIDSKGVETFVHYKVVANENIS